METLAKLSERIPFNFIFKKFPLLFSIELFLNKNASWSILFITRSKSPSLSKSAYAAPFE